MNELLAAGLTHAQVLDNARIIAAAITDTAWQTSALNIDVFTRTQLLAALLPALGGPGASPTPSSDLYMPLISTISQLPPIRMQVMPMYVTLMLTGAQFGLTDSQLRDAVTLLFACGDEPTHADVVSVLSWVQSAA